MFTLFFKTGLDIGIYSGHMITDIRKWWDVFTSPSKIFLPCQKKQVVLASNISPWSFRWRQAGVEGVEKEDIWEN